MFKKFLFPMIVLCCFKVYAANDQLDFQKLEPIGAVFYVRVFNGYLPLPSRYVMVSPKEGNKEVRFYNPGIFPPTNSSVLKSAGAYGAISIGQREQCSICNEGNTEEGLYTNVEEYVWKHAIKIKILHQENNLSAIYIFDEKSYLYVFDSDDKLWKKILANFSYQPVEMDKPFSR